MAHPVPISGYAYTLKHSDAARAGSWSRAPNDDWDSVMITPSSNRHYMWVGRRRVDGSEVNVWDDGPGRRYVAQTTVMTGRALQENQGGAAPFILGAIIIGGALWYFLSSKEAEAAPAPAVPTGCPITQTMLDTFAKSKGYTATLVSQPVSQWTAPKTKPPANAKLLSKEECVFYKWDGTKYIVDQKTSEEFIAWANVNVTKGAPMLAGHPADLFAF